MTDRRLIYAQLHRGYSETEFGQHPAVVESGPIVEIDRIFKPVRDLGIERVVYWLPAGKIQSSDHVMPSANWMPLSERDRDQWDGVLAWCRDNGIDFELYTGYNPYHPLTREMPRNELEVPNWNTGWDYWHARLNIKPWTDRGCKKVWFDYAGLLQGPANRETFHETAAFMKDQFGIESGMEAIPTYNGEPDYEFAGRYPVLAMYSYLMNPYTGRDRGEWDVSACKEAVCVFNRMPLPRQAFELRHYEDIIRRGYVPAATTLDQAYLLRDIYDV